MLPSDITANAVHVIGYYTVHTLATSHKTVFLRSYPHSYMTNGIYQQTRCIVGNRMCSSGTQRRFQDTEDSLEIPIM